jgi:2,4-dienoyl-CoA reductase-like NADH-dependent reductase (Old Yellow Enzyme family)/thioredoxin reductase
VTENTKNGYEALFEPFSICDVEIPNRIVFQPHFTALGTADGLPTDAHRAYHEARAAGGAGLLIFESMAVHPEGKMSRHFIDAWDPKVIGPFKEIVDAVHKYGSKIFGQLTHSGHTSLEHPTPIMWAPTQMQEPYTNFMPKPMGKSDIKATIEGFAISAKNVIAAGFDGIEIKIAHDGLLRSFASPFFNHRQDEYGGTFEKRMRLCVEVLEAIKKSVGPNVPLGVRLCLNEFTPWGYELDYGLRMAEHLEESGFVDYFNCDAGTFSSYWMEIPPFAVAQGSFQNLNIALKKQSKLPVIAFGRLKEPGLAVRIIERNEADFIGMARQLIADPNTPNKIRTGRSDEIRECIACNTCAHQVGRERAIRCTQNPNAGRENELNDLDATPAPQPKMVLVVGAGPAGMKVAEVAARRGHDVMILEKSDRVGGLLSLAAKQPLHDEVLSVSHYLETQLRKLKVQIVFNTPVSAEVIRESGADVVVLATGSRPRLPENSGRKYDYPNKTLGDLSASLGRQTESKISGIDGENVFSSDQVMIGNSAIGKKVVVIEENGHWESCGTAEHLADQGHEVYLVTSRSMVGGDLEGANQHLFVERAIKKSIKIITNATVLSISSNHVELKSSLDPDHPWKIDCDSVVPVIGRNSEENLYIELSDLEGAETLNFELLRVGDAVAPRTLESIIYEAALVGSRI